MAMPLFLVSQLWFFNIFDDWWKEKRETKFNVYLYESKAWNVSVEVTAVNKNMRWCECLFRQRIFLYVAWVFDAELYDFG